MKRNILIFILILLYFTGCKTTEPIPGEDEQDIKADLLEAVRDNIVEVARRLLESGADVNMLDEDNDWTLLMMATNRNHVEIVELLIAFIIDPEQIDRIIQYLINKGRAPPVISGSYTC